MTQSVIVEQHHGEPCSAEDEPTRLVEEVFSKDLRVGEWLATGGEERQRLQQRRLAQVHADIQLHSGRLEFLLKLIGLAVGTNQQIGLALQQAL